MKILVVEDDPLIQRSLSEMVEAWGYACEQADDGEMAWSLLQAEYAKGLLELGKEYRRKKDLLGALDVYHHLLGVADRRRHPLRGPGGVLDERTHHVARARTVVLGEHRLVVVHRSTSWPAGTRYRPGAPTGRPADRPGPTVAP